MPDTYPGVERFAREQAGKLEDAIEALNTVRSGKARAAVMGGTSPALENANQALDTVHARKMTATQKQSR